MQAVLDAAGDLEEHLYQPRQKLDARDAGIDMMFYVARGTVLQQTLGPDGSVLGSIKHGKGSVVPLRNLLPNSE